MSTTLAPLYEKLVTFLPSYPNFLVWIILVIDVPKDTDGLLILGLACSSASCLGVGIQNESRSALSAMSPFQTAASEAAVGDPSFRKGKIQRNERL